MALEILQFQFHKVRLKASGSSPSDLIIDMFQFHKVRLKDRISELGLILLPSFQFHKVRLKESLRRQKALCKVRFNSIRYD